MKYLMIFLLVFLVALPVSAGERLKLPEVETIELNGVQHKCLNVEQWKQVLVIANEYDGLYEWRLKTEGTLKEYQSMITMYEAQIMKYKTIADIHARDREYLNDRIKELWKIKESDSLENRIEKYLLYALVVAEAAAIVAVSLKFAD